MRFLFIRRRLVLPAIAALLVAVAFASVAPAATTSVTFKLKGQYAKQMRNACGKRKRFRLYHRNSTIEFKGVLTPHPARHFSVAMKVERCSAGRYRKFHTYHTRGKNLTGKYKGFLKARGLAPRSHRRRAIVYYVARVRAGGVLSRRVFFAVTN